MKKHLPAPPPPGEPGGKMTPFHWIRRLIQGCFIGGGAILPGISGGVLCVTFGLYHPMMALLSHPIKAFFKYYRLFIPVVIGWLAGFYICAKLANMFFSASSSLAVCFFIGLIAGSVPGLFKEANKNGKTKGRWVALAVSFAFMFGFFFFFERSPQVSIQPNFWAFLFCGVLWGLSLIVPGLTSSSVLIFADLYEPMTAGISNMDISVIGPMVLGIVVIVLLLSRVVSALFDKRFCGAYHAVIGFVLASTVIIIPTRYAGVGEVLACIGLFIAGFAAAWIMERVGQKENGE